MRRRMQPAIALTGSSGHGIDMSIPLAKVSADNSLDLKSHCPPLVLWDPLGLGEGAPKAYVKNFRESELQHGQVATMAVFFVSVRPLSEPPASVSSRAHMMLPPTGCVRGATTALRAAEPLIEAAFNLAATATTETITSETAVATALNAEPNAVVIAAPLAVLALTPFGGQVVQALPFVDIRICLLQAGASLFASIFGFGDAVIAVPLLAVLFQFEAVRAAPLVVFVSFFLTIATAASDFQGGIQQQAGRWSTSAAMIGGAVAGVPLGVAALVAVEPYAIRAGVGIFLLCYGLYDIFGSENEEMPADEEAKLTSVATTIPYGFAAGFLGGAIAEPGPVAVVLGKARGWSPPTLRAMLARFFLPVQILSLASFGAEGLLSPDIVAQGVAALPFVLAASAAGTIINRRVDPEAFSDVVGGLVAGLGVLCLSTAYSDFLEGTATRASSLLLSS